MAARTRGKRPIRRSKLAPIHCGPKADENSVGNITEPEKRMDVAETNRDTILVVDDTLTNVEILREVLRADYEVRVATDGETALIIATADLPDIILLDIIMPGMDGYEVCRRLKAAEQTRDIPVIFISAMGEVENEIKGFELGAVDFISKPINPTVVLTRVQSHLKLKKQTRQLDDLSTKLSKYLSPQVYGSIFRGEHDGEITSRRKKLSVYFSDIVGFTSTTEGMETEQLTEFLNNYLDEMSQIAIKHGGTIDKFIGDSILIFFGDPTSRGISEDAVSCVEMAIEMRESMKKLQEEWYIKGMQNPFRIRAGINTGYCTVGNFGSKTRMDYTIIGSNVNIASRLESIAEPDQILISHETWSLVRAQIHCLKNRPARVKGISQPIQSYQVVDLQSKMKGREKGFVMGYLARPTVEIKPDSTVRSLAESMDGRTAFDCAVVVRNRHVQGIVMNYALKNLECAAEDKTHFYEQPVNSIMDSSPLELIGDTRLERAVEVIFARVEAKTYDCIVVSDEGGYRGVVSLHQILEALSRGAILDFAIG